MKILYLWVEKSRNKFIENQGFNISGEFNYQYNSEEKKLYLVEKAEYIKNFWADNINELTAIVGINGSGKSTLLSEIIDINRWDKRHKLVVFEENGRFYYAHNMDTEITVPDNIEKKEFSVLEKWFRVFVSNSMGSTVRGNNVLTDFTINERLNDFFYRNDIPNVLEEPVYLGQENYNEFLSPLS